MQITVKIMGVFKDKTPEGGGLELPDDATIDDALQLMEIQLVLSVSPWLFHSVLR